MIKENTPIPSPLALESADARIRSYIRKTPLLTCPLLNARAKRRIFVKAEALQHTGSFKYRGALSAISALSPQERAKGVIAYSSGNHAQGIARAAKDFGADATIVMPKDAPAIKIANTRALGGKVVFFDRAGGQSREEVTRDILRKKDKVLIKPFDNENVIAGQGTCGLELLEQITEANITKADILVCCGGGGLTSGIALAFSRFATDFAIRPVEPIGFDDVIRSLATGTRCENPKGAKGATSICDAILTPAPGALTFPLLQRYTQTGIVMSDDAVKRAMVVGFEHFKLVLEPGGAIALAAALYSDALPPERDVIAIATGGNVDPDIFADILSGK